MIDNAIPADAEITSVMIDGETKVELEYNRPGSDVKISLSMEKI